MLALTLHGTHVARKVVAITRRFLLPVVLWVSVLAAGTRPVLAGTAEDPAQVRLQAKERALSRSVVKLQLRVTNTVCYVGTGVYVENGGHLFLLTVNHVVTVAGKQPEDLGDKLTFRSYDADPDDPAEWHSVGRYAAQIKRVPSADFAVIVLARPIEGLVPAKLAELPAGPGDRVIAFGFAAKDGHSLPGTVTGADAAGGHFLAVKLAADHGDSGGPVFTDNGKLVGLISASADPKMTERFVHEQTTEGSRCIWNAGGTPMGADTLAVHLPALLAK